MAKIGMLDFGAEFQGDTRLARPRTIAWPVIAYRAQLPETSAFSKNDLNPFENLLISLLDIDGPVSVDHLSQETCIPEDFVRGVLLRLQDKHYIDDRNSVIKYSRVKDQKQEFKSALVFQEQATGKVLPYILYDQKPAVKEQDTGLYCWQMAKADHRFPPVKPDDVLKALKDQIRHDRAYGDRVVLPQVSYITVSPSSEAYYLECPIGLRSLDGEFRIANPFGKGYSVVLEDAFLTQLGRDERLEGWIESWRESLGGQTRIDDDSAEKEPYENERCKRMYPRLVSSLKPNRFGIRSIEKIYSAIEWALYYSNERFSSRNAINLLRMTKPSDTSLLLKDAAEEMGIEVPARGFPRVQKDSLDSYQEQVPEMPTALAIALVSAQYSDQHPIRAFAAEHPDVAVWLYQIKKERDLRSHGKGRGSQEGQNGRNESFMKEFVAALVPDVSFTVEGPQSQRKVDALSDARFEARSELLSIFGYANFNRWISPLAQDRLVDAECFWESFSDGDNALPFVGDLYAALQSELSVRVDAVGIRVANDRELEGLIFQRAKALGIDPLPAALSTVRTNNIRKALQGFDETTLGALVVAYMLSADQEEIERIMGRDKTFFSDVGEIIGARGHLNETRSFSKKQVDRYREIAYKAIAALTEN